MSEQPRVTPTWIRTSGLISATLPESPLLQKYKGGQRTDTEALYTDALSDAALEKLKQHGVNLVWLRFFDGFGIEFEKAEAERAREFINRAHAKNLKVAAIIEMGSLFTETLLLEESDCQNWMQINQDGQPVPAPIARVTSLPAVRPCYNAESYLRYMERVCGLAVDYGADLIHFGNLGYDPEPNACRCPVCVAAYRDYLRTQYGAQEDRTRHAGKDRFGHNTFTHARPPQIGKDNANATAESPHLQEWTKFKVRTITSCLSRLARAVYKRNPECAVGADILRASDACSENLFGISYAEQFPLVDLVRESAQTAACNSSTEHETLQVKALKSTRAFEVAADRELLQGEIEANLALSLTLNPRTLGNLGSSCAAWLIQNTENPRAALLKQYAEFYQRFKDDLLSAKSLAQVAIYRDSSSRIVAGAPMASLSSDFESEIYANRIGVEPLYPNRLHEISRYRCVILAGCECIGEEAMAAIAKYVEGGGGLLVVGTAGARDSWGRYHANSPLNTLAGDNRANIVKRQIGKGRVAYVPQTCESQEAQDALDFAIGSEMPWRVAADGGHLVVQGAEVSGGILLQVVNIADEPARNLRVSLKCEGTPQSLTAYRPGQEPSNVGFATDNGRVNFTAPDVRRYRMFKLNFSASGAELNQ